ncbi:AMP-binding protein [Chitinophaga varians]|uniref:AMP-binding protein n=1 Tax=Chitinophaga varians TaxID=2202339 RepID=UPI00165F0B87|nr:AMP-binding protein [Chitinophaga varians]MBC9909500.1 AMP-binding protein [Chitinophaga varians]
MPLQQVPLHPSQHELTTLLAQQAARVPDAVALRYEGTEVTYRTLHERSNQLAHYLQRRGVKANKLVPVCVERSVNMLVAILGILKAGAAYVPIDPEYPEENIRCLLEDTGAYVMISSSYGRRNIPKDIAVSVILLDHIPDIFSNEPISDPGHIPQPHDAAYMLYTAGVTGHPKGVTVDHKNLLHHLTARITELSIHEYSVIAFTAPYITEAAVWQMLAALACGGTTIIYPDHVMLNTAAFIRAVDRHGVTLLELAPSHLATLLGENTGATLKQLEYLLVAGEAVSGALLEQWFNHPAYSRIPVVNTYCPGREKSIVM